MDLETFNQLDHDQATQHITQCCAAQRWVAAVMAARPFRDLSALIEAANDSWQNMGESDFLEAFSAHPQIGNVETLRAKFANTKAIAAGEQGAVAHAEESTLTQLAEKNQAYLARFGFIFIVCATGKSADEMLTLLNARLDNTRTQEIKIASEEQHKITLLRLNKLFSD